MTIRTGFACGAFAIICVAGAVAAQTPAPAAQAATGASGGPAVASPTYTSIPLEITVNRPVTEVWKRIGKFCDIGEWLRNTCAITSGTDGQLGAVRLLGGGVIEMLVAKTDLSYTYAQPVRVGVPYNAYHGTLEAVPVTATTSKLKYSFFYDNSMLANDAARATEQTNRRTRFGGALQNMKILAEGGTLPPAPPPAR